jgi:hypothetical protein
MLRRTFANRRFSKEVKDVFPKKSKVFVSLRHTFICRRPQLHSASTPHWQLRIQRRGGSRPFLVPYVAVLVRIFRDLESTAS